jgi:HK97 gp10 family phage protein
VGVTVTGLDELLADLDSLPARAQKEFPGVVSRGALQIKLDWKRQWSPVHTAPHQLPHLARGIGYDLARRGTHFSAEIGVAKSNPQSPLAHFAEFGSINNPPHPGGAPALRREAPKYSKAVADLAEKLLSGG